MLHKAMQICRRDIETNVGVAPRQNAKEPQPRIIESRYRKENE